MDNRGVAARLGSARALACRDWRPRQSQGVRKVGNRIATGGVFGEAPKSAREARALPRMLLVKI